MTPTQTRHLRVNRARDEGVRWLLETLNRQGKKLGTWAELQPDNTLLLRWDNLDHRHSLRADQKPPARG
ncbi:hypothetical protein ACFQAT_00985 [Undibacterium arcticum]|uniref:Transposase n=1 Tax=Undibacterium arcticum TaxID=1762892 RepID=A0ABV7F1S6_9BURK